MLNEIEIACWQIINEEINVTEVKKKFFIQRLMMTALFAKKQTNSDETI